MLAAARPGIRHNVTMRGLTDTFDRIDGPSLVLNRSDGGLWTMGPEATYEILTNRLIRTDGPGVPVGGVSRVWMYADIGHTDLATFDVDFSLTNIFGSFATSEFYFAADPTGTDGFHVQIDPFGGVYSVRRQDTNTVLASYSTAQSWDDGVQRRVTVTWNATSGAITLSQGGVTYLSLTAPSGMTYGNGFALLLGNTYSAQGSTFGNVNVTFLDPDYVDLYGDTYL